MAASGRRHLIMWVFIVAQCGGREHRGVHVMINIIKREIMVDNLQRKVPTFVKKRFLCRHVKGQLSVTRDCLTSDAAIKRNETFLWTISILAIASPMIIIV